jgi:hypothetical protein
MYPKKLVSSLKIFCFLMRKKRSQRAIWSTSPTLMPTSCTSRRFHELRSRQLEMRERLTGVKEKKKEERVREGGGTRA